MMSKILRLTFGDTDCTLFFCIFYDYQWFFYALNKSQKLIDGKIEHIIDFVIL